MKATVYHRYGAPDVVKIENVPKPVPERDEILVRIRATTVCAADWRLRKADPFFVRMINGLWRPKRRTILGMEFAGTIERVGKKVKRFKVGDDVFGSTGMKFGAHAEYVCAPQDRGLAMKPHDITFDEAAAIPFGGVSALHFLREAEIEAGQNVLIYGASGSVGTFAVQLAKHFGARVTGVCSGANLDLVKSLGADEVVDYTSEDFSKAGRVYDIVFDTVGKSGFRRGMKCLKRGGHFAWAIAPLSWSFAAAWASIIGAAKFNGGMARARPGDLDFLRQRVEAGEIRPVIDRRYGLDEIAEAHRYVEAGHKKGNVVIVVS